MQTLYRIVRRHPVYFTALVFFIITALVIICNDSKAGCFIKLNPVHERWMDIFFIGLTCLGDGVFSLLAAAFVVLLWKNYQLTIHIVIAYLASGIVALVLKRIWMAPRPREVLEAGLYKNFLAGISQSGFDSFPSGHTTSAFALATILALHSTAKGWGLLYLIVAIAVGYSRIYLGQHFLPDVAAGATLGTATGVLVYAFTNFSLRRRAAGHINSPEGLPDDPLYSHG